MSKRPRALRPNKLFSERAKLREDVKVVEEARGRQVEELKTNPVEFFRQILGFEPTVYEKELIELFQENQFLAARWCRQSGKSWTISALLLNYALIQPDAYIGVVGPSWRQTKLNIRRISYFVRRLPPGTGVIAQKTRITCPNGSVIEAFPNNPDTIRGPTLNVVWWDEVNFTPNDADLYDAILFTLGTTNGKLIGTSTPWNTDSLFWKMCNHKDYDDFARHHVTWEQAQEPNGPLKKGILDKIRKQFGEDPSRWRREMEAEWAEEEDVWLAQSLIVSCIGTVKNCGEDLQPWDPEKSCQGDLFAGLDLAQTRDYCILSVIERLNDKLFLRHLKIFQQPTLYATVLGYLKMLQDRWGGFQKIRVDITREGPSIIADMENAGINNAEGVTFSVPRKSEMASLLKQRMSNQKFFYPLLNWERPYRGDICTELNVERYDLRKDGTIGFSHPNGTHDDVFWAIALAVYATVEMSAEPFLVIVPR
ncbi:MAG TPA: terminase family protein [Candidatus Bathyarchaeia archaeon]|nr:terminase family protein [Candidatus Bathyarchaeia archaeon]